MRVVIRDGRASEQEHIPAPKPIRDVVPDPDGVVYLLADEPAGEFWRIRPLLPSK